MRIVKTISALAAIGAAVTAAPPPRRPAPPRRRAPRPPASTRARSCPSTATNRTFRLRDTERGTVRVKVNGNTRFERINGFSGLKAGMRNVETIVRRSGGVWLALEVERSGGGGEHGGGDDDDGRRRPRPWPRARRLTRG